MSNLREEILHRLFEVQSLSKSSDHNLEEIRTRNADAILDAVMAAFKNDNLPKYIFPLVSEQTQFVKLSDVEAILQSAKSKETK